MWYLRFEADVDRSQAGHRFNLSSKISDILQDTGLEFVPYSGVVPIGPTNCDISSYGLVFSGRTHEQSTYTHRNTWTSDLFFIPISQLQSLNEQARIQPLKITIDGFTGCVSSPIISTNGTVAFLKNEDKTKLTSKNHIFILQLPDDSDPKEILVHSGKETQDPWPLNPESMTWSNDKTKLLVSAADGGHQRAFEIAIQTSITPEECHNVPVPLEIGHGSISSVHRYSCSATDNRLLVSMSGFGESSTFLIVDPSLKSSKVLSPQTECSDLGLHRGQISEIWFGGHGDYHVHSWIIKPSYFKDGERYPLALLVHGGPHSSWQDSWSTRWNPMVFAEQGYIVVSPDITGTF